VSCRVCDGCRSSATASCRILDRGTPGLTIGSTSCGARVASAGCETCDAERKDESARDLLERWVGAKQDRPREETDESAARSVPLSASIARHESPRTSAPCAVEIGLGAGAEFSRRERRERREPFARADACATSAGSRERSASGTVVDSRRVRGPHESRCAPSKNHSSFFVVPVGLADDVRRTRVRCRAPASARA